MADRVGQQLGNYRLVRLLGRGGFAEVYLGKHLYLESYAALKILHAELSDEDAAKFLEEGQILARLEHSHIVGARDFTVVEGTPFLVMDYVSRGTLRQRYPSGVCLPLDTVVTYVKHIASALQYAHSQHVIHRDIKPENMLLGKNREVLLSDFGLALFAPSPEMLSTQKDRAGTFPYMAPEQFRGKPSFASDQYALAIVVYEWLCGVRPFDGSYLELLYQHASVPPPPLREKDPSLPETVESVVLRALAKDPAQRYENVQFFAQELEQACQRSAIILSNGSEVTGFSSAPSMISTRVFLSSSPADSPFVTRLQADLQRRGITVWSDPPSDTFKHNQENMLRQAIRAVDAVVLVLSSSYTHTSPSIQEHLRIAALYQRRLISIWATGDNRASLFSEANEIAAPLDLIDARETHYEFALDELQARLEEEPNVSAPKESLVGEPRNPYKGLRAFTKDDAADFFGRETLIGELVDSVTEILKSEQSGLSPARLLAVIGPSGSGKSSVVMAGLLPRLQQNILPGSEEWLYLKPMVPGARPLEALTLILAPHLPDRSLKSIREDLEDDSARGLHLLANHLVQESEKKVVLFIDQFEEAFNLTASEDEREHFFALLLTAITERNGPMLVMLTLRADFYDRLTTSAKLGKLISHHQSLVWPMEADELRIAVKGPASLPDVLLTFQGNLLADLLYEVREQAGALPLLQFTLDQLFERRRDHMLTQQAYKEIGGVKGALAKHAEETYLALPSEKQRELARTLFLHLIDPGITEQDTTRRRAKFTELIFPDPEQTHLMQETTDIFVKARLLTTSANENIETTIEVSHEALIREWPRLVDWLRTTREDIHLQHVISEDAAAWEHNKRPGDRLYRGTQFKEARAWAKRNTTSKQEHAFLQASSARQLRASLSLITVLLLVIASSGIAGWIVLHQPVPPPKAGYVTTTDEYATGSLRWAIGNAHTGDTITFAPNMKGQTIKLQNADIHIFQQNLTIKGLATGHITIHEIGASLIVDKSASVTISDLIFQGSKTTNDQPSLIQNQGELTLFNCTVTRNTSFSAFNSSYGGGIYSSGSLTMTNSAVTGNTSLASSASPQFLDQNSASGGGIYSSGSLTMTNSVVTGNTSNYSASTSTYYPSASGGGIYSSSSLIMTNSMISGNTSISNDSGGSSGESSASGGGIYSFGSLTMTNSTVSGNASTSNVSDGGGIFNGGSLMMTNSTISGNTASPSSSSGSYGGGISSVGSLMMTNSTVSGNTAPLGGGIAHKNFDFSNSANTTNITLIFCNIMDNSSPNSDGFDIADIIVFTNTPPLQLYIKASVIGGNDVQHNPIAGGVITSGGYNVIQHMSSSNFNSSPAHDTDHSVDDLTGVFGPHPHLQNNEGSTQTYLLIMGVGNPAVDKIPLDVCTDDKGQRVLTDQRGMPRPGKNKQLCDVGAYESQR
jgi:serine/threonine protein kinase